ncbi:MOSC domain-containing protein [Botrimarina hoheduenensis]|uniref:6-N-hydroxylaminopurine resistance protein n=1 Tax=Botrimarina hoheduenensis TaxID=2528000 RepID=A0A5C5W9S8_9BACT|nr:MOSC domain-containing protein [Botrimarina hoheduenensis]TWT47616.1 6-N-hydroxylaminopurine resistance protein [Botrimarina hoheduenensis]
MATLESIQVGTPREFTAVAGDTSQQPWTTAFYKQPVNGPIHAGRLGLEGDSVADPKYHGGPDKAMCVYTADHFPYWREELGFGEEFGPGAFGENLTIAGLTEADVCLGDVWQIDGVRLQVSQPRQPCWKIARRWCQKELTARVQQNGYTGWYVRVLVEGPLHPGEAILLAERPLPEWPLTRANEVMHHRRSDRTAAAELAAITLLAEAWRAELTARIKKLDKA